MLSGVRFLRFRIITTSMLLASVVLNVLILWLLLPLPPPVPTGDEEPSQNFDYSDYKYVFINYASWMIILLLVYGIGALMYTVVTKSATDIMSVFRNFNAFVIGSEPLPPIKPLSQMVAAFVLVSFASSMYMVESRQTDAPLMDGATRFASVAAEDEAAEVADARANDDAQAEALARANGQKDLVETLNWIHLTCILCFAGSFMRAMQF